MAGQRLLLQALQADWPRVAGEEVPAATTLVSRVIVSTSVKLTGGAYSSSSSCLGSKAGGGGGGGGTPPNVLGAAAAGEEAWNEAA